MLEAQNHGHTTPPPSLHLVETPDESPEDTIVQERDEVSEVLTIDKKPDAMALQVAFGNFENDANQLPDTYQVMGSRLFEKGGAVYKISIVGTGDHNYGSSTTVDISLAPDGSPHWKFKGNELDLDFQDALVDLIEDNIAEARRA